MNATVEQLLAIARDLSRQRHVREARVRDKRTIAALHEHLETMPRPPEGVGLLGITIYEDEAIPVGVIRFYFSDNTTKDLRVT